MTRQVSKAAIDALADMELPMIFHAFALLKASAEEAGVPFAAAWQLDFHTGAAPMWRIVDFGADRDPDGTGNTAVALQAATVAALHLELTAYRLAVLGMTQIRHTGCSEHLMAPARRQRPPMTARR
ncbi:hypothetical protein ACFQY4_18150 [Catellatospora bangladeshensis]|uniref:Uncharacterized protein n=1 Tax=Catellatospora bangladeshensis TaxID=310355 RepID=A0A8J3JK00_9ACTN|nr:hypothetical protein [Catellatospora bangladeshensis]GIF82066.1 hypothetical protein Cba03nite_34150 [Catellatospora bangladeshensis]